MKTLAPNLRKLTLTAHIVSSLGWFGSVTTFLALALIGLNTENIQTLQSTYISMMLAAKFSIVPFAFASFLTGLIQSLGTPWGLFRHYWIIVKLSITLLCTGILLLHMRPINYLAKAAINETLTTSDHQSMRLQLVVNASAALIALLVAAILAVYKPKGLTPYGWRKQQEKVISNTGAT